jgi:hypothetical protein
MRLPPNKSVLNIITARLVLGIEIWWVEIGDWWCILRLGENSDRFTADFALIATLIGR